MIIFQDIYVVQQGAIPVVTRKRPYGRRGARGVVPRDLDLLPIRSPLHLTPPLPMTLPPGRTSRQIPHTPFRLLAPSYPIASSFRQNFSGLTPKHKSHPDAPHSIPSHSIPNIVAKPSRFRSQKQVHLTAPPPYFI